MDDGSKQLSSTVKTARQGLPAVLNAVIMTVISILTTQSYSYQSSKTRENKQSDQEEVVTRLEKRDALCSTHDDNKTQPP
jgi:hypothetical protein